MYMTYMYIHHDNTATNNGWPAPGLQSLSRLAARPAVLGRSVVHEGRP